MGILKILSAAWASTPSVSADKIIAAMEPWTLACAVGAENGTVGVQMGFEPWMHLSKNNWLPTIKTKLRASESQIEVALRQFVAANKSRHMNDCLARRRNKTWPQSHSGPWSRRKHDHHPSSHPVKAGHALRLDLYAMAAV